MTLPTTTRAAVLTGYSKPLEICEIAIPEPEPGSLIVRVEASTMCGTDVHMAQGDFAGLSRLPLIMGHEIVGRVVPDGKRRQTDSVGNPLRDGDRVVWAYAWCSDCYWCVIAKQPTLCANKRQYGWGPADEFPYLTGGYSEYAYVMPICKVLRAPDNLDPAIISSATCALRTVVHGFEQVGGVPPMGNVVIQGAGPVGLYALAYSLVCGADQVFVIGAPQPRLNLATRWGAAATLDIESTTTEERISALLESTDGRGADLVVDAAGTASALEEGFELVRRGGSYLVVGQSDPTAATIRGTHINLRQLAVAGSVSGDIAHYYRALRFLIRHQRRFDFSSLLSSEYTLETANDAFAHMRAGEEIKPVIHKADG